MTPSRIREKVIVEKTSWIRKMLEKINNLPIDSYDSFISDSRNIAAVESYLRRALEALMDLGRHILAKGFGKAVTEYKDIPLELLEKGVLSKSDADVMREMAGYRNRMVHFYNEISAEELHKICFEQLKDLEAVLTSILQWINSHSDLIDHSL
ncbi:MAG: type VII toxin-antitoxin system HepT family RNase toxin [bacterium]